MRACRPVMPVYSMLCTRISIYTLRNWAELLVCFGYANGRTSTGQCCCGCLLACWFQHLNSSFYIKLWTIYPRIGHQHRITLYRIIESYVHSSFSCVEQWKLVLDSGSSSTAQFHNGSHGHQYTHICAHYILLHQQCCPVHVTYVVVHTLHLLCMCYTIHMLM